MCSGNFDFPEHFFEKKAAFVWMYENKQYLCTAFTKRQALARLAQLVEQLTLNQRVQGSNP